MFDEKLPGGDRSRRDLAGLVGDAAGADGGTHLLLRFPLSLALLVTSVLLTTVMYLAVTIAMVVVLPIRFLGGFFSRRGWDMFRSDEDGDKEPVNGVQNFAVSLLKVIPAVILWPLVAIFTSVPTLLLSTLAYVWSVCKTVVGYLFCAFTFSDPVRQLQDGGRPEYQNYVDASGMRASADVATGFFDENGPHVGVRHPWNDVKSAFMGDDLDILKSMVGGGVLVGMWRDHMAEGERRGLSFGVTGDDSSMRKFLATVSALAGLRAAGATGGEAPPGSRIDDVGVDGGLSGGDRAAQGVEVVR